MRSVYDLGRLIAALDERPAGLLALLAQTCRHHIEQPVAWRLTGLNDMLAVDDGGPDEPLVAEP